METHTRSPHVGWLTGLFFHLFIYLFNKNSLSVYSCRALYRPWRYKHEVLFMEFTASGIWEEDCCWEALPRLPFCLEAPSYKVPEPKPGAGWIPSSRVGWVGCRLSAHLATQPEGEVRKEKREESSPPSYHPPQLSSSEQRQ